MNRVIVSFQMLIFFSNNELIFNNYNNKKSFINKIVKSLNAILKRVKLCFLR